MDVYILWNENEFITQTTTRELSKKRKDKRRENETSFMGEGFIKKRENF